MSEEQNNGEAGTSELTPKEQMGIVSFAASLYVLWHAGVEADEFAQAVQILTRGYAKKHGLDEQKTGGTLTNLVPRLTNSQWVRTEINTGAKYSDGMIWDKPASNEETVMEFLRQGWRDTWRQSVKEQAL